ncbi:MAG: hypothetical protein IT371_07350 [Deltaproteobacteria bacterium]|nr:hypothetical protein [Deltaproteobacteria bacterium]
MGMQSWQIALLVVASVFVGMWIPVSLQLFATLRAGQRFLKTMGSRGEQTLAEVSTTVVALNETIAEVKEVAHAAAQIKDSIRIMSSIGAAVGPAVVALVRALREPAAEAEDPAGGNGISAATEPSAPAQKERSP